MAHRKPLSIVSTNQTESTSSIRRVGDRSRDVDKVLGARVVLVDLSCQDVLRYDKGISVQTKLYLLRVPAEGRSSVYRRQNRLLNSQTSANLRQCKKLVSAGRVGENRQAVLKRRYPRLDHAVF